MTGRARRIAVVSAWLAGSIVLALVLLEVTVRLFFASPHVQGKQLLTYTPHHHHDPANHGADCYPSNPRGYFERYDPAAWPGAHLLDTEHYRDVPLERIARTPFCAEFHTNSHAHRGPDHHRERAPNTFRVLASGDSFVFGEGVKDADTMPAVLERTLQARHPELAVEVVNLGVPGLDTGGEILAHKAHADLDADVVVLGYVLNDAFRGPEVEAEMQMANDLIMIRPGFAGGGWLRRWSKLYDLIATRGEQRRIAALTKAWYRDAFDPSRNPQGLARTEHMVDIFADNVAKTGARFLVAVYPILYQLGDDYPFAQAHEVIEGMLDRHRTPWLDLRAAFAGHSAESLQAHPVDHHPNEVAQRLAAEAIAAKLEAMGVVHARPAKPAELPPATDPGPEPQPGDF